MELWNNILQNAIVGTAKKNVIDDNLQPQWEAIIEPIKNNSKLDSEEKFLQIASVFYNYKLCATELVQVDVVCINEAPNETCIYLNQQQEAILNDALNEDVYIFIKHILEYCVSRKYIVNPTQILPLIEILKLHKPLQRLVYKCIGNRGIWLLQYNTNWKFYEDSNSDDLWHNGKTDQRKELLKELRSNKNEMALKYLQETWSSEDVNVKLDFLEIMKINCTFLDLKWLGSLKNEKSKKVQVAVIDLLKRIPESEIVSIFEKVLKQSVFVKNEKIMLGLSSKKLLHIGLPVEYDESIFDYGIEQLSGTKNINDELYILKQLIENVPPLFWEKHLQLTAFEIIPLFEKHKDNEYLMPALVMAIIKFNDIKWAKNMEALSSVFYLDILPLLPNNDQVIYCNKFFKNNVQSIIEYAINFKQEWSIDFAKKLFEFTANNVYQYNKKFFKKIIHLIPFEITPYLNKIIPQQQYYQSYSAIQLVIFCNLS